MVFINQNVKGHLVKIAINEHAGSAVARVITAGRKKVTHLSQVRRSLQFRNATPYIEIVFYPALNS